MAPNDVGDLVVAGHLLRMSHYGPAVAFEKANDPIFRMRAYSIAFDLVEIAWQDAKALSADPVTNRIAGQLYAAVSSITANIGEGYSRSTGKDRARFFEFALGSVRESIAWYQAARPALGAEVRSRLNDLEELRRLLLAIIPGSEQRAFAGSTIAGSMMPVLDPQLILNYRCSLFSALGHGQNCSW